MAAGACTSDADVVDDLQTSQIAKPLRGTAPELSVVLARSEFAEPQKVDHFECTQ